MKLLYIILVALSLFFSALAVKSDLQSNPGVAVTFNRKRYLLSKAQLYHNSLYLLILVLVLKVAF
jgi:hypothetical protein